MPDNKTVTFDASQYQLVPKVPTDEMLDAASHASMQYLLDCIKDPVKARELGSEENVRKTHASRYQSMLAAAPAPAAQSAGQEVVGQLQVSDNGETVQLSSYVQGSLPDGLHDVYAALSADGGEVKTQAATVHRRIDALCEAANAPGADYFDASTNMLIATRDLLKVIGHPHAMDIAANQARKGE